MPRRTQKMCKSGIMHQENIKGTKYSGTVKSIEGVTIRQLSRITGISKNVSPYPPMKRINR
jgi:hypothetical protein